MRVSYVLYAVCGIGTGVVYLCLFFGGLEFGEATVLGGLHCFFSNDDA